MWRVSALQAGAEAQPPRRALVRSGGIGEEGGGRRQAGGFGGGGPGRAAGHTAGAALVRAAVRAGEARDRVGAAHPAPPRAQARARAAQGVFDRRRSTTATAYRGLGARNRLTEM